MLDENFNTPKDHRRIALGVSGGIAVYKAVEILRGLQHARCDVRVAMTRHACEFVTALTFRAISGSEVIVDDYAPANADPIAHISFSQTVDVFVVAPATANIIAKFANGIADDFVSTTYLACTAPVLVAPAMNTTMWNHPTTRRNIERLRADGVHIIEPEIGEMACRTFGPGRMAEPAKIVEAALSILRDSTQTQLQDLAGERVLVTAGATREEIDPVRFISNRSSGRMGFAVAEAARMRGADVTVIAGITTTEPPPSARIVRCQSAEEMHDSVMSEIESATIFIGAAAVADYRPVQIATKKIKKSGDRMTLELEPTKDILRSVSERRTEGLLVVGFAAETNDVVKNARDKLVLKNLDAIVANDVSRDDAGFDVENNAVTILTRDRAEPIEVGLTNKLAIAHRILDEVVRIRREEKIHTR